MDDEETLEFGGTIYDWNAPDAPPPGSWYHLTPDDLAGMPSIIGLPVRIEHDEGSEVGKITAFDVSGGRATVRYRLRNDEVGRLARTLIKKRSMKQLSLRHTEFKRKSDGKVLFREGVEVSLVGEGARPRTDISASRGASPYLVLVDPTSIKASAMEAAPISVPETAPVATPALEEPAAKRAKTEEGDSTHLEFARKAAANAGNAEFVEQILSYVATNMEREKANATLAATLREQNEEFAKKDAAAKSFAAAAADRHARATDDAIGTIDGMVASMLGENTRATTESRQAFRDALLAYPGAADFVSPIIKVASKLKDNTASAVISSQEAIIAGRLSQIEALQASLRTAKHLGAPVTAPNWTVPAIPVSVAASAAAPSAIPQAGRAPLPPALAGLLPFSAGGSQLKVFPDQFERDVRTMKPSV